MIRRSTSLALLGCLGLCLSAISLTTRADAGGQVPPVPLIAAAGSSEWVTMIQDTSAVYAYDARNARLVVVSKTTTRDERPLVHVLDTRTGKWLQN